MKKALILAGAALLFPAAALAEAPFCAVTAAGAQCVFYDLSACRHHLSGVGGECVANPAVLPRPQPSMMPQPIAPLRPRESVQLQHPDMLESYRQGQEHGARMRLLEAQTAAARATPPSPRADYTVTYSCTDQAGKSFNTEIPMLGCVVVDIQF